MLTPDQARSTAQEGLDALRRGDGAGARATFELLLRDAPDAPPPWLPLAQACRLVGDAAGETRALAALLTREPRHLAALLMMGDRKRGDGDDRAATSFYSAAINQAAVSAEIAPTARPCSTPRRPSSHGRMSDSPTI